MGELVDMNVGKAGIETDDVPRKLSYDELENVCKQLSEQNNKLYEQLRNVQIESMFKRLDYLFKVVENSEKFDPDFASMCSNEIILMMDIRENNDSGDINAPVINSTED